MRRLVRETTVTVDDLVLPLFVKPGQGAKDPIQSMTGCYHFSPDMIAAEAMEVAQLGIPGILLFGLPEAKDERGSGAWSENGAVQQAVAAIKEKCPDLLVMTDICLCAYTDHGHCGVFKDKRLDNDATCELLAKVALSHVQAGADVVAPSDMMDGRISYMRQCLEQNGYPDVPIMSYAAKYASAYYGPFRDACGSAPAFGDRRSHQMDPANGDEALREVALDLAEGADIVMVKPALPYLDIVYRVKSQFSVPVAAYNVSGEYAMIEFAAKAGAGDRERLVLETLLSIRRAGADLILTYHAPYAAELLQK